MERKSRDCRWPLINTYRALTSIIRRGGFNQHDIKLNALLLLMNFKISVFVMTTNHDKSFLFLTKMFVAYKSEIKFQLSIYKAWNFTFFLMQQTCIFKTRNPCFTWNFLDIDLMFVAYVTNDFTIHFEFYTSLTCYQWMCNVLRHVFV